MNIEKRIRQIAAKKVKVVITGKTRCKDGFTVSGLNDIVTSHPTRKEALSALLARVRCSNELAWKIEPVRPNPKAGQATETLARQVMKPFAPAIIPLEEAEANIALFTKQWRDGEPTLRKAFKASSPELAAQMIREYIMRLRDDEDIFLNDVYQVNVRERESPIGKLIHLSIKRRDKQSIHDWRDLQAIKNELVGQEYEAVELYPAESRVVDTANQYHLWCSPDPEFRFPFGFNDGRIVTDTPLGKSVNRPVAG